MTSSAGGRALCLLFRVRGERVAVPIGDVAKVVPLPRLSTLPRLPALVLGLCQHRGRVVTAIDVGGALFPQLPQLPHGADTRMLLLERGARHLALVVDVVSVIETLRIHGELPVGPDPSLRVTAHTDGAVLLLDTDRFIGGLLPRIEESATS